MNLSDQCKRIIQHGFTLPHYTFSVPVMRDHMKMSRQAFQKHKNKLISLGLIKQIPGVYPHMFKLSNKAVRLGVNHFSCRTTRVYTDERIGMEDVYITIPRSPDSDHVKLPKGFWEKINDKLNNNVQKHTHLKIGDYNVSVRETSKSIVIQMSGIKLTNFNEAFIVYNTIVNQTFRKLAQFGYWINPEQAKCSDPEFTYLSDLERSQKDINRKPRVTVKLGYPRSKLLPGDDPEETWAKFDDTPDEGNFETNDVDLARERRIFPVRVRQTHQQVSDLLKLQANQTEILSTYAKEIETHLGTYHDMKTAISGFESTVKAFRSVISTFQGVKTPRPSQSTLDQTMRIIENMESWQRVKVRVINNYDKFEVKDHEGQVRIIEKLKAGSEIYLSRDQARSMLMWGEAELV